MRDHAGRIRIRWASGTNLPMLVRSRNEPPVRHPVHRRHLRFAQVAPMYRVRYRRSFGTCKLSELRTPHRAELRLTHMAAAFSFRPAGRGQLRELTPVMRR